MFDTSNVGLSPTGFEDVLALCFAGSLYVSKALLSNLSQEDDTRIRYLIGNINRPGLALLYHLLITLPASLT